MKTFQITDYRILVQAIEEKLESNWIVLPVEHKPLVDILVQSPKVGVSLKTDWGWLLHIKN